MVDNYRHKGMRKKLVSEIKSKGIKDIRILEAVDSIPRHLFLDSSFLEYAYEDKPFPIGSGQTISQPYTVAFQTELLQIKKGQKILEIGTGSGYQAAILSELTPLVYSIEIIEKLGSKATRLFKELGYNTIKVKIGDGYEGWPEEAPFDAIMVTACASSVPTHLVSQLKDGGHLLIPISKGNDQILYRYRRQGENLSIEESVTCRFVPLLSGVTAEGEQRA